MHVSRRSILAIGASLFAWPRLSIAEEDSDELLNGFRAPPNSARPRVWWHWMNGNVSSEGVQRDFDWMQRVGIGGVQNFDASLQTPVFVDHEIRYLTPEWRALLRDAVARADRMSLEFTVASSPGWSETGGPWVTPEQAMKKLVWTETRIEGGHRFQGHLTEPPSVAGPFGVLPVDNALTPHAPTPPNFYRDVAVIAFRAPVDERILNDKAPTITTSSGAVVDAQTLKCEDQTVEITYRPQDESVWIQLAFAQPQTARAATIAFDRGPFAGLSASGPTGRLEASDDGQTFRAVSDVPSDGAAQTTVAFAPATARYLRLSLPADHSPPLDLGSVVFPTPTKLKLFKFVLHGGARIDRFENKAGFGANARSGRAPVAVERDAVIAPRDVIDLTVRMSRDGALDWTPPAGRWIVVRMGCSLTGVVNHPASPAGTGLEVDKLNREHVRAYMDAYLATFRTSLGDDLIGARGLTHMLTDSYEAGPANWTDGLFEKFRARCGYDLRRWLPVITGRVIDNVEASEAFLWDFRKTLGELIVDEHYGEISRSLHAIGMKRYGESHEAGRAFIGDGMQAKRSADIPMSATWAPPTLGADDTYNSDIRESASVAHIYGKPFVAAESFTAQTMTDPPVAFTHTPEILKPVADRMMAHGLNRFVIHTSVHQALDRAGPGLTLGPFGQWFTRNETWAEQAGAWVSYLARSSHLLQQGRFVADIAYLYGEDCNITQLFGAGAPGAAPAAGAVSGPPPIPDGYNFDYVNPDALLNELTIEDGRFRTRSGMRYRVLTLDPSTQRMSLAVLRKLGDLAQAGGVIVGEKPVASPSLRDDQDAFRRLADQIWRRANVVRGRTIGEALAGLGIAPDFTCSQSAADAQVQFVHRALDDGDLYFVRTARSERQSIEASFRVSGRAPEIWRADTGGIESASYRFENDRTLVPLTLEAHDALFVVFRTATTESARAVPAPRETVISTLDGAWDVAFPPNLGAPAHVRLPALRSWTEHGDPGVRYFSGVGRYTKTFQCPAPAANERIVIDLGAVKNLADVIVNGRTMGTAWKAPFRVDITEAVRNGQNGLEVRVANSWRNRLIGDKQPGARQFAFTTLNPMRADTPLLPSGLLGPVRLLSRR